VHAFHVGIGVSTVFVALGGVLGLVGIRPRRRVRSEGCTGGQLARAPKDACRLSPGRRRRDELAAERA
jgi:hypothetical protein